MDNEHKEDLSLKNMNRIANQMVLLTQLGLSFIMPLLLCIGICWFLTDHFGVGTWVYLPGFFFGLGGSFMTAYKFYLAEISKNKKNGKDKKVSFNRHL